MWLSSLNFIEAERLLGSEGDFLPKPETSLLTQMTLKL